MNARELLLLRRKPTDLVSGRDSTGRYDIIKNMQLRNEYDKRV